MCALQASELPVEEVSREDVFGEDTLEELFGDFVSAELTRRTLAELFAELAGLA